MERQHKIISSKMKKMRPLHGDPILMEHVPETYWFDAERLRKMYVKHKTVYVKPDRGRRGNGIGRFKRLDDSTCELCYEHAEWNLPFPAAAQTMMQFMKAGMPYLVQQGIDLSTYMGRPFHIRAVMLKPAGRWQLSLVSAIVARHKDAIVTNVAQGNEEMSIEETLHGNDQQWNPLRAYRDLTDLSHQFSQVIGKQLPVLVLGLDLAIDKGGKIWLIEANTKPNVKGSEKVNDASSIRKYVEAFKWIR